MIKKNLLSRQYLESLSTTDLITIADDYGIDIPDNLNRRFIIGELLEAGEELLSSDDSQSSEELKEDNSAVNDELPKSYNHTKINTLLRNPAWAFVFWDIREQDSTMFKKNNITSLILSVHFYDNKFTDKISDSFEIQVEIEDREQYVLLPAGKKYFSINLEYIKSGTTKDVLASTRRVEIPQECQTVKDAQPGQKLDVSPLVELSGMESLLRAQFLNHRQSFS